MPEVSYTRGWDKSGSLEGAGGIGGLLARSHGYSSGSWSTHNFYHADGNGNITMMLDSSQATVATYKYDPYGNSFTASGSLASANLYRFSSKLWCANAGLYYYGYRFYDPNLQRWLNHDPIGERGGLNLYGFVGNSPISSIDLFGLKRKFTSEEQAKIDELLNAIRACAGKASEKDILKALEKLDLQGIFDANDVKNDASRQNDSETTFGFYWLSSDTVLAADFFKDNNTWDDKTRSEVLIHEAWHAWKKAVREDDAYKFGADKCNKLWDCIKDKLKSK